MSEVAGLLDDAAEEEELVRDRGVGTLNSGAKGLSISDD